MKKVLIGLLVLVVLSYGLFEARKLVEGPEITIASPIDGSIVAGDYHNGPLTLIIPFGIWGILAFLWFLAASVRVLWINCKNSESEMRTVNTFLLCFFLSKIVFFSIFFGSFYVEFVLFAATVALSVSINRGIRMVPSEQEVRVQPASARPEIAPGSWQPA